MIKCIGNINNTAMCASGKEVPAFFPEVFHFKWPGKFVFFQRMAIKNESFGPIWFGEQVQCEDAMQICALADFNDAQCLNSSELGGNKFRSRLLINLRTVFVPHGRGLLVLYP